MRFLLLLSLPVVELVLLVSAGRQVGGWAVLGFLLASAMVGGWLARWQGRRILRDLAARQRGRAPLGEREQLGRPEGMVSAAMVSIAGVLLIVPGFLSTAAGLALLLPPVRRALARRARGWFERTIVARAGIVVDASGVEHDPPEREVIDIPPAP